MSWRLEADEVKALAEAALDGLRRLDEERDAWLDRDDDEDGPPLGRELRSPAMLPSPHRRRPLEMLRAAAGMAALAGHAALLPLMLELHEASDEDDDEIATFTSDGEVLEAYLAEAIHRAAASPDRWQRLCGHPRGRVRRAVVTATPQREHLSAALDDADPMVRCEARLRLIGLGEVVAERRVLVADAAVLDCSPEVVRLLARIDTYEKLERGEARMVAFEALDDRDAIVVGPRIVSALNRLWDRDLRRVVARLGRVAEAHGDEAARAVFDLVSRLVPDVDLAYSVAEAMKAGLSDGGASAAFRRGLCGRFAGWLERVLPPGANRYSVFDHAELAAVVIGVAWPAEDAGELGAWLAQTTARMPDANKVWLGPWTGLLSKLEARAELADAIEAVLVHVAHDGWPSPWDTQRAWLDGRIAARMSTDQRRAQVLERVATASGESWVTAARELIGNCHDPERDGPIAELAARFLDDPRLEPRMREPFVTAAATVLRPRLVRGELGVVEAWQVLMALAEPHQQVVDLCDYTATQVMREPATHSPVSAEEWAAGRIARRDWLLAKAGGVATPDVAREALARPWDEEVDAVMYALLIAMPFGPLDDDDRAFLEAVVDLAPAKDTWPAERALHVLLTLTDDGDGARLVPRIEALARRIIAARPSDLEDTLESLRVAMTRARDLAGGDI